MFPREVVGAAGFLAGVEDGLAGLANRPTLLVWGDKDRAFGKRERTRFERIFTDSRHIRLRGAGHFIQEDAPGRIVDAIQEWIGSGGSPPRTKAATTE